jgi:formylglycine-generating enzyme required for sulfatase activity
MAFMISERIPNAPAILTDTCPGCAYFHPTNSGECRFNNLADMIGNVAEWVLAADGTFQKRGGSAGSTFNATCTSTSFAGFGSASDGLRCCWSP